MSTKTPSRLVSEPVELGDLLANTIGSVIEAQERMDSYTEARRQAFEAAPEGSMALPPLWYVFDNVSVELELSAQVAEVTGGDPAVTGPHLVCNTVDPLTSVTYGREVATGLRVRVDLSPEGYLPIKHTSRVEVEDSED